jgi:hypothetical protein
VTSRPSALTAATVTLGTVALLLLALLTLRHVGQSYFLADQVDQLQKYEAALRLEPEGLWGPAMSGTVARALGPFGALVFGLPVSLGLGIDAIHALTSLLLAIAAGIAFWQLARLNQVLAWGWLIVFTAMRMVWWNAAMFWVNTLLLPLGLLVLALFAANLRRPSLAKRPAIALVLLLAMHVHLAAIVGLPVLLIATFVGRTLSGPAGEPGPGGVARPAPRNGSVILIAVMALLGVALLPYFIAEAKTSFRNTRAMFGHVEAAAQAGGGEGARAARETLLLAADPMALFPDRPSIALAAGFTVTLAALAVLALGRRRVSLYRSPERRSQVSAIWWLVVTALTAVAGQALFFQLMARPLNGLHYAILLAPWYAIVPAALVAAVTLNVRHRAARWAPIALGAVAVLLLIFSVPDRADRFAERTPWNYRAIVTALDTLCADQAVETLEGSGLLNELTPSYDSVLRYLMKRGLTQCRYDATSDVVIAANRGASFDESIDIDGRRFIRERVLPPGLARYRRVP